MELLGNHKQLKLAHESIMSNVEDNMKNLHEEKSLIATGNKQIAEMVENIKQKLGTYIVFDLAITVKILWNKQHFFVRNFILKSVTVILHTRQRIFVQWSKYRKHKLDLVYFYWMVSPT